MMFTQWNRWLMHSWLTRLWTPLILGLYSVIAVTALSAQSSRLPALVIHGGAGTIRKETMTPELEAALRADLTRALDTGYTLLQHGSSALDAVEATIRVLEERLVKQGGDGA